MSFSLRIYQVEQLWKRRLIIGVFGIFLVLWHTLWTATSALMHNVKFVGQCWARR